MVTFFISTFYENKYFFWIWKRNGNPTVFSIHGTKWHFG
jgi:hypothetical protein